jgi:hypothetical protein
MTAVVAWVDADEAVIIADSAARSAGSPQVALSSFGEAQAVENQAVEESAFKLLRLPREILAGVAGNADRAFAFLAFVSRELVKTTFPLSEVLREAFPIFDDPARTFDVVFAHSTEGEPCLTVFQSSGAISQLAAGSSRPGQFVVLGSMPPHLVELTCGALFALRLRTDVASEARLVAALSVMQALGLTNPMTSYGIGGAFFGARHTQGRIAWQPDVTFLIYSTGVLAPAPDAVVGLRASYAPPGLETARSMVRAEGGIVVSSLSELRGRVLIPATTQLSLEEWQHIVAEAPQEALAHPSRYHSILNRSVQRATIIAHEAESAGGRHFSIEPYGDGNYGIRLDPRLVRLLEDPPRSAFDVILVEEGFPRTRVTGFSATLPA